MVINNIKIVVRNYYLGFVLNVVWGLFNDYLYNIVLCLIICFEDEFFKVE